MGINNISIELEGGDSNEESEEKSSEEDDYGEDGFSDDESDGLDWNMAPPVAEDSDEDGSDADDDA